MFKIYCVYDKVSKELSAPFLSKNDQTARRMWKNDCKKVPPEDLKDYDLVAVGHFNPDVCWDTEFKSPITTLHDGVVVIMTGEEIVKEDSSDLEMPSHDITCFADKDVENE